MGFPGCGGGGTVAGQPSGCFASAKEGPAHVVYVRGSEQEAFSDARALDRGVCFLSSLSGSSRSVNQDLIPQGAEAGNRTPLFPF